MGGGGREGENINIMDIERWEKLDQEERLKLVKGKISKSLPMQLANPLHQKDMKEMAPKSRSTKRIKSGVAIEANQTEPQSRNRRPVGAL